MVKRLKRQIIYVFSGSVVQQHNTWASWASIPPTFDHCHMLDWSSADNMIVDLIQHDHKEESHTFWGSHSKAEWTFFNIYFVMVMILKKTMTHIWKRRIESTSCLKTSFFDISLSAQGSTLDIRFWRLKTLYGCRLITQVFQWSGKRSSIWIPMLWVWSHYKYVTLLVRGWL